MKHKIFIVVVLETFIRKRFSLKVEPKIEFSGPYNEVILCLEKALIICIIIIIAITNIYQNVMIKMRFHLNSTRNLCTKLLLLRSVQFSCRGNVGVGFTGTKIPCKIFRTHLKRKCRGSFVEHMSICGTF